MILKNYVVVGLSNLECSSAYLEQDQFEQGNSLNFKEFPCLKFKHNSLNYKKDEFQTQFLELQEENSLN
jgi:hypothetical protein